MNKSLTILVNCTDEKGLIYKITRVLYENGLNIVKNKEFVDEDTNRFFMRTEAEGEANQTVLLEALTAVLPPNSRIEVVPDRRKRLVILATRENHCLGDLLMRNHFKEWNAEISGVISNYDLLKDFTERFNLPYHYIAAETLSREEHEQLLTGAINNYAPDYIVLARYMRILTPNFVQQYKEKIINIHHSFLPAFIGAQPYRQAYERGVKIIGATAHFVNDHLDEGPIICQNVIPVDHSQNAAEMSRAGKGIEKMVLAQALKLVLEDRVMLSGNKTVIF
ncbi:formyltetrahydrofolate deformylase [Agriterribacter sp.]|uniref:formyltetrahydrofolate deformylase n=1 Tax=Agriterribacter sp. TaxID=2821509 RepID=UPI002CCE27AD|nr:formyltetrahydrofolate deformylase [Agriterribacter sp.]HTN06046.1 formyltetrahydrofolate deformylase [Agriterribacter sp.]